MHVESLASYATAGRDGVQQQVMRIICAKDPSILPRYQLLRPSPC